MAMAGRLGYTESVFWATSPRFFFNAAMGVQMGVREGWEQARYMGYLTILPHVDKKKRLAVKDLGQFPWELEAEEQSREERLLAKRDMLAAEWQKMLDEAAAKQKEKDERSET